MKSMDKGTMPCLPIQTSLNKFVANCRNFMGECDGSDRFVSTPGAPNIRIVPSVVPVEFDAMTSIGSKTMAITHRLQEYSTLDQKQRCWHPRHDRVS